MYEKKLFFLLLCQKNYCIARAKLQLFPKVNQKCIGSDLTMKQNTKELGAFYYIGIDRR